jgi:hypothetical protein
MVSGQFGPRKLVKNNGLFRVAALVGVALITLIALLLVKEAIQAQSPLQSVFFRHEPPRWRTRKFG